MSLEDGSAGVVSALIGDLSAVAHGVEVDDLAGLAKMHGWAERVVAATKPDADDPSPDLCEQAAKLTDLLEGLILGEAEDAEQSLNDVTTSVNELVQLVEQGAPAPTPTPDAEDAPDDATAPVGAGAVDDAPSAPPPEPIVSPPAARHVTNPGVGAESATGAEPEPPYESTPLHLNEREHDFIKAFVEEAQEHVETIETALLDVERDPKNKGLINDLFRPFHTIKGMAGFLNLRDINCLTHEAETVMDHCRKGKRVITPGMIDCIFDVVDVLKAQIAVIATHLADPKGGVVPQPPVAGTIEKLRAINAGRLEPEGRQPPAGGPAQPIGETLVEQGVTSTEAVEAALQAQDTGQTQGRTGEILIESGVATPRQVSQALRAQAGPRTTPEPPGTPKAGPVGDQSVRIDTSKLDALVDMVGELVIAQTQVGANTQINAEPKLAKDVGQVTKIVRDVQEVAMAMRMVPIGPTFQKMARLIRDVSRKAGKQVELRISGEDTELDKNVIQQIGDPLVHMIRNAVDHGIESPDDRVAAGKPVIGNVRLSAYHQGGNIAIEISDDGKGLDRDLLIRKAVEKGLIDASADLTDSEAFALIFTPGFSTAAKVTDISGRGVGMDVVRRNLEALRGRVDIRTEKGSGSTFTICLPLTLAIIDGMVVRVGSERFIIQTITIEQSLRPTANQITTVQHRGELLNNRGQLIPLIQLGQLFGLTGWVDPCEAMVVIVHCEGRQIGLVVERLIGQQQVVIKALGERFKKLQGISGAAILGDGRVGLILEMAGLAAVHEKYRIPTHRIVRSADGSAGATGADDDDGGGEATGEPPDPSAEAEPDDAPETACRSETDDDPVPELVPAESLAS